MNTHKTIGSALDYVQANFGAFDFGNLLPHLRSFTKSELNEVAPIECNEPLVRIYETERIIFIESTPVIDNPFFRERAWVKLQEASWFLPKGLGIGIIECLRPSERQRKLREERFLVFKKLNPKLNETEIWKLVDTFIAGVGGPHQTGGAIDCTLVDLKTRKPLDMGSPKIGLDKSSYTASNLVSLEAQVHRYILCVIMTYFGFRNYPAEWWHYEFGTKRHSRYMLFPNCMYDALV